MDDAKKEINIYVDALMDYLVSGKLVIKSKQFIKTYSCIVKLCDVDDLAPDLYNIYQTILNDYINSKIYPSIQKRIGDSREFLAEYVH